MLTNGSPRQPTRLGSDRDVADGGPGEVGAPTNGVGQDAGVGVASGTTNGLPAGPVNTCDTAAMGPPKPRAPSPR